VSVHVIRMAGIVVKRSGEMTGGLGGVEGRAHRWEDKQLDAIRLRRDDINKEVWVLSPSVLIVSQLAVIVREARKTTQLANLDSAIKGSEVRVETARADRSMTLDKLKHIDDELKVCMCCVPPQ
jgi:hypothetical protein